MGKFRTTVRLYKVHDSDLIGLYMHPEFRFRDAFMDAVRAYAAGDAGFKIRVPKEVEQGVHKPRIEMHLDFDTEKDAPAVRFLSGITHHRNHFIKHIFRMYLTRPYGSYFYGRADDAYHDAKAIDEAFPNVISYCTSDSAPRMKRAEEPGHGAGGLADVDVRRIIREELSRFMNAASLNEEKKDELPEYIVETKKAIQDGAKGDEQTPPVYILEHEDEGKHGTEPAEDHMDERQKKLEEDFMKAFGGL